MLDRSNLRTLAALVFATALVGGFGCGADTIGDGTDEDWVIGEDTGTETRTDTGPDGECAGPNPGCHSCRSDTAPPARCVDGEWTCSSGEPRRVDCAEPRRCGEKPTWACVRSCAGEERSEPTCGMSLWYCPPGTFRTDRHCESECEVEVSSTNLDGVEIRFPGTCRWSIDKVREGIEIPYEVVVEQKVGGVIPHTNRADSCDRPGDSGLITSAEFTGNDQRWCRCDSGLCTGPEDEPVTLEPGTYRNTIEWEGRNWTGPSDTGNPKGEPFPPGTYELSVLATGERVYPDAKSPFELEATMEIELIE